MRRLRLWALIGVAVALGVGLLAGALTASNPRLEGNSYPLELAIRPDPLVYVWELRPGETAQFFILLHNRWDQPISPSLSMEPRWIDAKWLSVTPQSYSTTLQPGEQKRVPFTLTADESETPRRGGEAKFRADWSERGLTFTSKRDMRVAPPDAGALIEVEDLAVYGLLGAGFGLVTAWILRGDWRFFAGVMLSPLYSRIGRAQALENERRRRILHAIEAAPGIHFSELGRDTGLPNGALYHHLRILEQSGLIATRTQRGRRIYALASVALPALDITAAEQRILAQLTPEGITALELAERLGMTRQGVYYHAKKLSKRGLLREETVEGSGRGSRRYYPN